MTFRTLSRVCSGLWILSLMFQTPDLKADAPHNDQRDGSVAEVVAYHEGNEPRPDTLRYLSWTPVVPVDGGKHKVTVVFTAENDHGRRVTKKQIVILDDSGTILRVMDCR